MVAFTNSTERLINACVAAWTPRDFGAASKWIGDNIRLSQAFEADAGSYDPSENPWWAEICDGFTDKDVRTISILKSTQVGGTLFVIATMLAMSVIDPAPGILVVPTQDEGRIMRDRIYANASVSSRDVARLVPPERFRNLISIDLLNCQTFLAWAGSKQRLRGKPCKYVWQSEIDVYESGGTSGDPSRATDRRTDQFPDHKIVRESSPVGDESPIANYYEASDQRQWWCECPHCKRRQVVRFFTYKTGELTGRAGVVGYQDQRGQMLDADQARENAKYICIEGCEIDQSQKNKFIRSGKWLPIGQSYDSKNRIQGVPDRPSRHRGYHIWQVFNHKKTWGDLAAAYVEHQRDGLMRDFFQNILGLRFRSASRLPEWHKVGRRMQGTHRKQFVPADAWFLTCGVDVQEDRVYYVVRAWAPGRKSWLVDFGEFMRDPVELEDTAPQDQENQQTDELRIASDLAQIDALLDVAYEVEGDKPNPLGKRTLAIRLIGVDANHRTLDVHQYVKSRDTDRLRAIRGDHQIGPREKYRMTTVDKNQRSGDPYEGGLELWGIKVDAYKQLMIDRIRGSQDAVGTYWLPLDIVRTGSKYLRQLVNEPPTTVIDQKTGRKKVVFRPKSGSIGVDYWDTTNYAEAMADMVVEKIGWSESEFRKWKQEKQAATERRASRSKVERSIYER